MYSSNDDNEMYYFSNINDNDHFNNIQHLSQLDLSTFSNQINPTESQNIKETYNNINITTQDKETQHKESDINLNALQSLRISYSFTDPKDNEGTLIERINFGNEAFTQQYKTCSTLKHESQKKNTIINNNNNSNSNTNHNGVGVKKCKEKKKTILSKDIKERLLKNYPLFTKKINFTLPMQQSLIRNNKKKNEYIYNGLSMQQQQLHKSSINSGRTNYHKLNNKVKMMNNTTTNINKPQTCLSFYNLTNKTNMSKYRSIYSSKKKTNDNNHLINRILNTIQIDSPYSNTSHYSSNTIKQKLKKNNSQQCTMIKTKKKKNINNNNSTIKIKSNKNNSRMNPYANEECFLYYGKQGMSMSKTLRMNNSSMKRIQKLEGPFLTEGSLRSSSNNGGAKKKRKDTFKRNELELGDGCYNGINLLFQKIKKKKINTTLSNNKSLVKK